jgi:hypothetical protein
MADRFLRHEENRGVHRLVMDHGPNALDRPLMEALRDALGTLAEDGGEELILWHDGSAWWRMQTDAPTLWWVHGFSHDNVWAVGEKGTILHFDGSDWETVQTGGDYTLWGIWGATPNKL